MSTVLQSLNAALHQALAEDERVILLGEDLLDPYGGAFKVARGLSDAFPERVIPTPISEAGFVGVATGMALRGLRPVVEIMFGDFLTLAADQLINHAAKFAWMYSGGKPPDERVTVPLVVRTPMGGRRGYGPTHSQTLEKLFLGIPGLRVLAPCALSDPGKLLLHAILEDDAPVLFIENKLLYALPIHDPDSLAEFQVGEIIPPFSTHNLQFLSSYAPAYCLTITGAPPPSLTIAAYGYITELVRDAALRLAYEREIFAEIIVLTQLAPFEIAPLLDSTGRTHRLLTVEEGGLPLGWGAELVARTSETLGDQLVSARRLAAHETPIPASGPLEAAALPGVEEIFQTASSMV